MACQRFRRDRGRTRGNRHRGAVNVCDRSGRSPVGRAGFAGWKRRVWIAGRMLERPSGGGTAGVVRWLARTRQAVHPFTRWPLPSPSLPAAPLPPVATSMYRYSHIQQHTHKHRESLFLSSELSSLVRSLSPPFPPVSIFPPFLLSSASPL